ncbi:hypothetical protein CBP52_17210 [Cellulomonas sp. PSBB021]|nr:hypothetical protein CBP52_17210 [Cellulomonas sp. PSBB021]
MRSVELVWFVLRSGVLPWALLVIAGVNASVFGMRGAPWRADLLWIVDWIPIGHIAIGPVIAGAAAIDMARFSVGVRHVESRRWTRSPGAAITLAYAVGVGAVYVATILVAALVELPPSFDPRVLLAVAAQLLMLTLFAAMGVVVGRTLTPVLGGVIAAVTALAGIYLFSARTDHIALLYAGSSLVPRVGRSYNVTYLGSQVVLLSILITALLLARRGVQRGRWRRAGERFMAVVAVALVFVAGSVGPSSRLTYTRTPPSLCADVSGVTVCMYPEHARVQAEVNAQLARLFDAAREAGYHSLVPSEVREVTGGDIEWYGASLLIDAPLSGGPVTLAELVQGLVDPWYCDERGGHEPPSEQFWMDSENVQGTWLGLADPEVAAAHEPYLTLTPDEIERLTGEFRTCSYPFR